eukprot:1158427-Pelagomonas_calceolata.AAC.2
MTDDAWQLVAHTHRCMTAGALTRRMWWAAALSQVRRGLLGQGRARSSRHDGVHSSTIGNSSSRTSRRSSGSSHRCMTVCRWCMTARVRAHTRA